MKKNIFLIILLFAVFSLIVSCSDSSMRKNNDPPVSQKESAEVSGDSRSGGAHESLNKPVEMERFNRAKDEGKPVVIDFTSPGCGACKMLEPTMDKLEAEWSDRVEFVKFDITRREYRDVAVREGVRATPTLFFIGGDGTKKQEIIGVASEDRIIEALKNIAD